MARGDFFPDATPEATSSVETSSGGRATAVVLTGSDELELGTSSNPIVITQSVAVQSGSATQFAEATPYFKQDPRIISDCAAVSQVVHHRQ